MKVFSSFPSKVLFILSFCFLFLSSIYSSFVYRLFPVFHIPLRSACFACIYFSFFYFFFQQRNIKIIRYIQRRWIVIYVLKYSKWIYLFFPYLLSSAAFKLAKGREEFNERGKGKENLLHVEWLLPFR